MKIEHVRVDAFGRLVGFDTGSEPLGELVVVLGPNEAGKSTLFHFLTTALYGFQPASRERSPYVPWGLDEAGGAIRLRLGNGACAEIERKLRSQPSGQLTSKGRTLDIRNQPVPWVEHVPRPVFRQVFAVTLADLAGLDEQTWARIQDRVVGSMGASDLRPARSVADELEREAGELWRPNRRGNQRVREIQGEIRDLRERRRSALERDRHMRSLVADLEASRARFEHLRECRQRDRIVVERVQSLVPLRARLRRIADLQAEGGPPDLLADLPADPRKRLRELAELEARLQARLESIVLERAEPETTLAASETLGSRAHERTADIARFLAGASQITADRIRARELEDGLRELEGHLERLGHGLLGVPWASVPEEAVASVPLSVLAERVGKIEADKGRAGALEQPEAGPAHRPLRPGPPPTLLTLLAAGLGLISWGLLSGSDVAITVGASLCAVAFTLLVVHSRSPRERRPSGDAEPSSAEAVRLAETTAARRDVWQLLQEIPLRLERVEEPDATLVADFGRMQTLLLEHRQKTRALTSAHQRLAVADLEAATLAQSVDLSAGGDGDAVIAALSAFLRSSERTEQAVEVARRDLVRLDRERDRLMPELHATAVERTSLRALVDRAAPGGASDPLAEIERRLAAHHRADQLEDELEKMHPGLESLMRQIDEAERSGESWTTDDEELATTRARVERVTEEIEALASEVEGLEQKIAHARELETADAVDSEAATLKEVEARLVAERDRKWVMAQLLREADRKFRQEHQPDILRRAGAYLEHLTEGRYDRLLADEGSRGDLFQLVGPTLPAPIHLGPPMSTGTLEQAYLSLRLAIVDHLDQGDDRLPLFVDEVFVNWDRDRRRRGLEVLVGLSQRRQLFVFTCHEDVAEELVSAGAQKLELARRA